MFQSQAKEFSVGWFWSGSQFHVANKRPLPYYLWMAPDTKEYKP